MGITIAIVGLGQMVVGVVIALFAQSPLHGLLAAVLFGAGTISLGLGVLIGQLRKLTPLPAKTVDNQNVLADVKSIPAGGWNRQ